jgi:hypothetical protein
MCNLYDYEMTPEIVASIIEHYRLVDILKDVLPVSHLDAPDRLRPTQ